LCQVELPSPEADIFSPETQGFPERAGQRHAPERALAIFGQKVKVG
jgi:hypothetical protein